MEDSRISSAPRYKNNTSKCIAPQQPWLVGAGDNGGGFVASIALAIILVRRSIWVATVGRWIAYLTVNVRKKRQLIIAKVVMCDWATSLTLYAVLIECSFVAICCDKCLMFGQMSECSMQESSLYRR